MNRATRFCSDLILKSISRKEKLTSEFDWRKQGEIVILFVSGFYFLCLIALDYDQNCTPWDCAAVHSSLIFFHNFDFSVVFPIINLFPIPLTLRLFVPTLVLFATMLVAFFELRLSRRRIYGALEDAIELALTIVVLFEIGIYYIDPDWWQVHFSNLSSYPFSSITNEDIAISAAAILIPILCTHLIFEFHRKNLGRKLQSLLPSSVV